MCSNTPSSPTAHALRVLPGQRHRVPHVRIRERRHQAVHVRPAPRNHGLRQTEIRLHHARRPLQPSDTRHREADAPASSASRTAARSGTNHRTPAPRPACHTRAWPYAAAIRGMNRSASNHLPINGLYGSSFETAAGRAGGSGEQSSNCAYLRTVCLDTPTSFDIRRQDTPLAPGNPDTLLYGRWHRHVLSFPRYLQMVAPTRESSKTGRANASPRRQHDHMVNFSPATRSTTPRQTGTQTIKQIQRTAAAGKEGA